MRTISNFLFLTEKTGEILIFKLKDEKEIVNTSYQLTAEHEGRILSLDFYTKKDDMPIFMTAGKDDKIKFWTFKKILLLQIVFSE